MKSNKYIRTTISILIFLLLGYLIYSVINFVVTLEKQIQERDVLIKELTYSNKYICGRDTLTEQEMVEHFNQHIRDYNDLLEKYNQDYQQLIRYRDSTKNLSAALKIIYDKYEISYMIEEESTKYKISITNTSKIDSALMLFPYFKENLKYDEEIEEWKIIY